jgi:hypothetical protein
MVGLACLSVLAFAPATASATPILWTLNGTITAVSGGATGTASGSFVYDADTNLYSNVAITTTLPAATFDTSEIGGPISTNVLLALVDGFVPGANSGKPVIGLRFTNPLTNLGGTVILNAGFSFTGTCLGADCNSATVGNGGLVSGQVIGTPVVASSVPEPATLFLCSAGLVGAGVRRWRASRGI